jgi:hypothetical protein
MDALQRQPTSEADGGLRATSRPGGVPEIIPVVQGTPSANLSIRTFSGHRMAREPGADERCLGCGWNGMGRVIECRPDTPRCEAADCSNPADVKEAIGPDVFYFCAGCRNALKVTA